MALSAVRRESSGHVVGVGDSDEIAVVAGITLGRRPCVTLRMAVATGDRAMRTRQRERAEIVIEGGRRPRCRRVALLAERGKSSGHMVGVGDARVIIRVTGVACR